MSESTHQHIEQLALQAEQGAQGTDESLVSSAFMAEVQALRVESPQQEHAVVRQVLAHLLDKNRLRIDSLPYPKQVQDLAKTEFDRIENEIGNERDEYFAMTSHCCRSDLRILAFGRIPVGPEHLEVDGLPRSVLFNAGPGQCCKVLSLALRTKGFKPFYVIHLAYGHDATTFLFSYSKRAQKRMFLNIAECLKMHPEIKGVLAGSWWHDPQLDTAAPHLTYLRTGWTDNGAEIFFWGTSEDTVKVATENSPARKELVEKGEYNPKEYIAVWPRQSLLSWAEKIEKK